MVIPVREFGQVLGDGMTSLVRTFRVVLPPALAVSLPASVLVILIFQNVDGALEFLDVVVNTPERLQNLPSEVILDLARPFYMAAGLATLAQLVTGIFVALVGHRAVACQVAEVETSARRAALHAARRYPVALLAVVVVALVVAGLIALGAIAWLTPLMTVGTPNTTSLLVAFLLFIALIGPGIWAAVSVSMTTAVVTIEGRGVVASVRRSMRLVRGRWWATTGFLALVGLLGGIAVQMIQLVAFPLVGLGEASAGLLIAAALGIFAQGIFVAGIAIMTTQWYLDLRARLETFAATDLV
jgi:hypothetical protein